MRNLFTIVVIVVATLGVLPLAPSAAHAESDDPATSALKQTAQQAYLEKRFDQAIALDLEIAQHPESQARRYAVQMLGRCTKTMSSTSPPLFAGIGNSWRSTPTRAR